MKKIKLLFNLHWVSGFFDINNRHHGGYKSISVVYYVKKEGENSALNFNGNFKRRANDYFQDCIGIINKIKSNEFNKHTIPEMVYYYNDFCAD